MPTDHRFIHAGPGTGKSTEILAYVGECVDQGIDPGAILVVTLTNVAAHDMREALKNSGIDSLIECTTLHSWCLATLQRNGVLSQRGFGPRIISGDHETACLLYDLDDAFGDLAAKERMLKALAAGWARLADDQPGWVVEERDAQFEEATNSWLRVHGAILLDQIVPEAQSYLRDNPTAPEHARYEAVIVDEYQDLNSADQDVLRFLSSDARILVAGDDDQSVYSFRYAHPDGIRRYAQAHPEAVPSGGNVSHRCPASVIDAARRLLQRNRPLDSHTIQPGPGAVGGQVLTCQFPSYDGEVEGICSAVRSLIESGLPAGEILVLTPWRELGYDVRDRLNQGSTGDASVAETFFVENAIRNRASAERFAILNLVAYPDDPVAWRVALSGASAPNRRAPTYRRVIDAATAKDALPHELLRTAASADSLAGGGLDRAVQWFRGVATELADLHDLSGEGFLQAWCPAEQEALRALRELSQPHFEALEDASEVFRRIEENVRRSDPPQSADFVRVMSIHKSKGLQARAVILAGAVDGLLPRGWNRRRTVLSAASHLQEQRRLLYVALTRTSNTFLITNSRYWGAGRLARAGAQAQGVTGPPSHFAKSSSFLRELGPGVRRLEPSEMDGLSLV